MKQHISFLAGAFLLAIAPVALSAQTVVTVSRPAPLTISGPTLICKGSETILKVEGDFESFLWNTGGTERFIKVKEEGQYEVTVKTKGGCTLTNSVNVRVKPCS